MDHALSVPQRLQLGVIREVSDSDDWGSGTGLHRTPSRLDLSFHRRHSTKLK